MQKYNVIYFDGVCNLCNSFISFVIALSPPATMKVAGLQGEYAKENLGGDDRSQLTSVIYQRNGEILRESSAVIRILCDLKWYFRPLYFLLFLPRSLRDGIYRWIARNRYKFFGKRETCRLPTAKERSYFLN